MEPSDLSFSSNSGGEEDVLPVEKKCRTSRKFSPGQIATLNGFYRSGMRGEGKEYAAFIDCAARETKLSLEQVKVSLIVASTRLTSTVLLQCLARMEMIFITQLYVYLYYAV